MLRILCGQPEAGNAKGKADAMVRLIRLHGVAPGKRSERDSRIVELRITIGVGNSSAAEAVSRSARGGCSKRRTEGTMRLIFRTVFRSAV